VSCRFVTWCARLLDERQRLYLLAGDHPIEDAFQRHCVAAHRPTYEEVAVTRPLAVVQRHLVIAVLSAERNLEVVHVHPVPFLGVDLCLFDLADQARLHDLLPPSENTNGGPKRWPP